MTNKTFFLGGHDLEMVEIAALLKQHHIPFYDKNLRWGAKLSDYALEIASCEHPVFVELTLDLPLPHNAIVIDHHGEMAHKPCSLRQVFDLLALKNWTHRFSLIEANDVGHIEAMQRLGATLEEILAIRLEDRTAQGITAQEEQQGAFALSQSQIIAQKFTLVHLPHNRAATVTDSYALGGFTLPLLIISPWEVNFYGQGAAVAALDSAFKGGWSGGELPKRGFWGKNFDIVPEKEIISFLTATI